MLQALGHHFSRFEYMDFAVRSDHLVALPYGCYLKGIKLTLLHFKCEYTSTLFLYEAPHQLIFFSSTVTSMPIYPIGARGGLFL